MSAPNALDGFLDACLEIEEAVRGALDPARTPLAEPALVALIREYAQRHGSLGMSDRVLRSAVRYVMLSMRGLGPLEPLLAETSVEEVAVNGPRDLWARHGGTFRRVPIGFYDDDHVRRILERLAASARGSLRQLDPGHGIQDFTLPDGSRLHVVHPELTPTGSWLVNLRRPLAASSLPAIQRSELLEDALLAGATVLIAGLPGSGKTTLARALLGRLPDSVRIVVVEEVGETRIPTCNVAHLQTRWERPGSRAIPLRTLVAAALRMSPHRLVVGEIRDDEALPFTLAIASGVPGLSTIHARDPRGALERLATLAMLAPQSPPAAALRQLIAEAVDLVVHLHWDREPIIDAIAAIEGLADPGGLGPFVLTDITAAPPPAGSRLLRRFPGLGRRTVELVG